MKGDLGQLELRRPAPQIEGALAEFFRALVAAGDDRFFHPHPFTDEAARERMRYEGKDVYCAALVGDRVLAYGMLRGWDEGFEVPSLGVVVRADARGLGLGKALVEFLHSEARRRGAAKVRLRVYPDNAIALALYRSLGYEFGGTSEGQWVGLKTL